MNEPFADSNATGIVQCEWDRAADAIRELYEAVWRLVGVWFTVDSDASKMTPNKSLERTRER